MAVLFNPSTGKVPIDLTFGKATLGSSGDPCCCVVTGCHCTDCSPDTCFDYACTIPSSTVTFPAQTNSGGYSYPSFSVTVPSFDLDGTMSFSPDVIRGGILGTYNDGCYFFNTDYQSSVGLVSYVQGGNDNEGDSRVYGRQAGIGLATFYIYDTYPTLVQKCMSFFASRADKIGIIDAQDPDQVQSKYGVVFQPSSPVNPLGGGQYLYIYCQTQVSFVDNSGEFSVAGTYTAHYNQTIWWTSDTQPISNDYHPNETYTKTVTGTCSVTMSVGACEYISCPSLSSSSSGGSSSSSGGSSSSSGGSSSSSGGSSSSSGGSSSSSSSGGSSSSSSSSPCDFCTSDYGLTFSGSIPASGTVHVTYQGNCIWSSGSQYQLYNAGSYWVISVASDSFATGYCNMIFTAPADGTNCPPTTGWRLTGNGCGGSGGITVSGTSSSSSTVNSCDSATACTYCDNTPSEIDVTFDNVIMYGSCQPGYVSSTSTGYYYSVNRGTINYSKTHQKWHLTQTSACTWLTTGFASNLRIYRYTDSSCSGTARNITGPVTVSITAGYPYSDYSTVSMTMACTTGEVIGLFLRSYPTINCGLVQQVDNEITVPFWNYLSHQGHALIEPCGNISSSSSGGPCCTSFDLVVSGTTYVLADIGDDGTGTGHDNWSDSTNYTLFYGGFGGAGQWNLYSFDAESFYSPDTPQSGTCPTAQTFAGGAMVLTCSCPASCSTCCTSYTLMISGGTSIDGTFANVSNSAGACDWEFFGTESGHDVDIILTCDSGSWTLQIENVESELFMNWSAPVDGTNCPPTTGWTVSSNDLGGTPALTITCA